MLAVAVADADVPGGLGAERRPRCHGDVAAPQQPLREGVGVLLLDVDQQVERTLGAREPDAARGEQLGGSVAALASQFQSRFEQAPT